MHEEEVYFDGTTAALALEYMRVWDLLLAEGSAEDLAKLHQHMVDRVLMDARDSPHTRMSLAIILASRCDALSEWLGATGHPAAYLAGQYAAWKETFEGISRGEEMEVRLAGRDGQERRVVFERGARFVRDERQAVDTSTLRWSFTLGSPGTDRKAERYFNVACLSVGPVLTLIERELAGEVDKALYVKECLAIFENCVRRVLFCAKMPKELRRAFAGVAFTPYCSLTPPTVATADPTVPLEPDEAALAIGRSLGRGDNLICLRKIAMQIANGGSMTAVLRRGDECLMRVELVSGDRQVVMSHEDVGDYDEEDLIEALHQLQGADLSEPEGGALDMRPASTVAQQGRQRKHPRPNELCSCKSGRKYKKCCGRH